MLCETCTLIHKFRYNCKDVYFLQVTSYEIIIHIFFKNFICNFCIETITKYFKYISAIFYSYYVKKLQTK